jgi:riboflavin kinase/FMN adenylyltransferase
LGAANIGSNPTFGENVRKIEAHLLDFSGDLVGETLAIDFFERFREIRRFAKVEELVAQLHQDIQHVRRIGPDYLT